MRALRARSLDGPSALSVDEVADPAPVQGAVRIAVHAAGVGFVDTLVTRGRYQVRQVPPFTPGMEVSGVVESAPAHSGMAVGDRVYASLPVGGCAETVWADEHLVAPLPESLTFARQGARSDTAWVRCDWVFRTILRRSWRCSETSTRMAPGPNGRGPGRQ